MTEDPEGPLAVHVVLSPAPGRHEEVVNVTRETFARIRAHERACLFLAIHVTDDSEQVMLYELWSDRASFKAFVERPAMVEYLADLDTRLIDRQDTQWIRTTG